MSIIPQLQKQKCLNKHTNTQNLNTELLFSTISNIDTKILPRVTIQ